MTIRPPRPVGPPGTDGSQLYAYGSCIKCGWATFGFDPGVRLLCKDCRKVPFRPKRSPKNTGLRTGRRRR